MDMSFSAKLIDPEDRPRDYCGAAHYLSPEQVSGQGHDFSVDYWALGILLHEMMLGANPWLTGDDLKDTELGIFGRISAHATGGISGTGLTDGAESFINGLLDPAPERRLGTRGVGAEEVRAARWMTGFDWNDLANKNLEPPHASSTSAIKVSYSSLCVRAVRVDLLPIAHTGLEPPRSPPSLPSALVDRLPLSACVLSPSPLC